MILCFLTEMLPPNLNSFGPLFFFCSLLPEEVTIFLDRPFLEDKEASNSVLLLDSLSVHILSSATKATEA